MCGIAGVVRLDGAGGVDARKVELMLDAIAHRGPDGRNVVDLGQAALGAVRLAVRDLSTAGAQPARTPDGRHHLVHNGELYDLDDLRRTVSAPVRSSGDTELLLQLLVERGTEGIPLLEGMFASAWWDGTASRLVLVRDRLGEKPLVYARHDGCLWFASEEKALFAAGVPVEADQGAWPELLLFRYVAGSRTPYVGVRRVLPGHLLEVADGAVIERPWHRPEVATRGDLGDGLRRAVRRRLAADVPIGLFLSGGLDSSSVAAAAVAHVGPTLPAFTVAYPGAPNDEVQHARAVASHLGLTLHELEVAPREVPALLEEATWLRGEPMAHAAGGHALALSRMAREEVTVVLSGEGADELLGGYAHHRLHRYPVASTLAGHVLRPLGSLRRVSDLVARAQLPAAHRTSLAGTGPSSAARLGGRPELQHRHDLAARGGPGLRGALSYEQGTYLTSVLATADRSTMGAGLESRAPFLDREVVARAAGFGPRELFRRGQGKAPLRAAMAGQLPEAVLRRRKAGWTAPWERYLLEVPALRERVRALPTDPFLREAPLDQAAMSTTVAAFLDGSSGRGAFGLVWALVRISVWHDVCVLGHRGVLT